MTSKLANRLYNVMVKKLGSPDERWKRWSFCYSLTTVNVDWYLPDALVGVPVKLVDLRTDAPKVVLLREQDSTPQLETILKQANVAIRRLYVRKPPKSVADVIEQANVIFESNSF